ncbi:phospholipid/cholesterol/gamma-HCH transport system substrate-binding protein [Leeuwenhoekiella aestuarii]|uniref:Phospholipid/cholesterol/gamma-HCH transport system substrate-binding protein n=1 Tax=Leeuwenhoekiella aestuarii TaxID=2249426 RepID=A0A4Q0NWN1_9FLAO|nr:MlaD family protein [Leeuwenhoekiella aestuarii]RXG15902.1 phospholipid/cholesterol/gamma-HCH transport system substrate-binding protein [Leeuwenhoekiella aestuarii]RXG16596.1 phospholipid/cholesterol/gamma-HCH transport system substrate-binding protein [Leeuwenhoekiella aestuarii]
MNISREVKTGLLAVVAIALLIFGYSFLKGNNLLNNDRTYYAIYDNVEGLSPGSNVTINGLIVGKVLSIDFADSQGDLLVTFNIQNDFQFSKASKAQIYGGGLIGGKNLSIVPDYEQGEAAESGDTLEGTIDEGIFELVNERLTPLQAKVESVINSTDSVLTGVSDVLDQKTRKNLRETIEDINATATNFKQASSSLNKLLADNDQKLSRTFTNLDEMSANFNKVSDSLSKVDINALVIRMESVLADFESISSKIERGEGTLGQFINDDQMYNNLERATKQMEELMQDIKLNPKRYVHFSVFGKNPGSYEQPKDSLK